MEGIITQYHKAATNGLPGVLGDNPRLVMNSETPLSESGLQVITFSEGNVYTGFELTVTIEDDRPYPGH